MNPARRARLPSDRANDNIGIRPAACSAARPRCCVSEGIARLMLRLEQEGSAELTLAHYRQTAWSLFEFLGRDPPIGQLDRETAARWLDWLRTTFVYRRARGAYPKWFTPSSVSAFLARMPPKRTGERLRSAGPSPSTAPRAATSFAGLGSPSKSEHRKRRKFRRLPPIVPKINAIAARWQATLQGPAVAPAHAARSC